MKSKLNFNQLIEMLLNGETEGISATGTLKLKGNLLIHYQTTIAERWNNKFIINFTRYSLPTGQLQKKLRTIIPDELQIIVGRVPINYGGSLVEYTKDENSK